MQRKLEELAAGVCASQSSILQFSPEKLEFEVLEGSVYTGEFSIRSTDGVPVSGIVYSTSPRLVCQGTGFQGTDVTQRFEFRSEGLSEGESQKGNLHIISDQGEYVLPFMMTVSKKYPESSFGKIKSIFEFANLARESYSEAVRVFGRQEFLNVFKPQETNERLIYQGLMRRPCTRAQVEEFLIAARKKKRVLFEVTEAEREFIGISEQQQKQVILKKEEWGHFALEVISEEGWIKPLKQRLTDEDFVGSRGMVEYMILPEKMHAGKNYGRLILQTPFQKEEIELCAVRSTENRELVLRSIHKKHVSLAREYLNFGMHKIVTGVWAKRACKDLEELQELVPDSLWYLLAKAQVFLANRQRQEAEWLLDSFPRNKVDKETPLYAYYLYLCTLREPEPSYVNKCTSQIRKIFHKHQDHPILLWILLFLDDNLNYSKGRKLEVIAKHIRIGRENILLYLEAWRILAKEPFLMGRANAFERKILYFAVKHQVLTKGMAEQVARMAPEIPVNDRIWYRILVAAYRVSPDRELLQAVCSYCIRSRFYGKKYWKWYQLGIAEELRITGLYEAWVLSADEKKLKRLPKPIALYFQSYSNLASHPQAMLYAAVIEGKSQWKALWPHYRKNMEQFVLRQLKGGKIDRTLAAVYKEVLTPELLTEEHAEDVARVLFTCEVTGAASGACSLVVCQHPLKNEQVVPLIHGKGYINLYSSTWQILLEDSRGRRFLPDGELKVTPLLESEEYLEQGIACAKNKIPYLLKYFDKKVIWQTYEPEDLPHLQMLLESAVVSEAYQAELRPQMVAYFYDNYTGDMLDDFLQNLSFEGIGKQAREKIMELLVARRHYGRAYELLLGYGCEHISPTKLVYVLCDRLQEQQEEGEDDFLLGFCRNVFLRGKYNEQILKYMCQYFYGSLNEMIKLWEAARNFELDTYELEERCLKRFLYTGDFLPSLEQVFECYGKTQGKDLVIQAYLTKMCHQYIVRDAVISDYLFQKLSALLREKQELNHVCRLGFLKWSASGAELTEEELALADKILKDLLMEGRYFAFYQSLPETLRKKYLLHDHVILQYCTDSDVKVLINYQPLGDTEYIECEMPQMYEGIFAKEFLIFYGESIPYYIKEQRDQECKVTESEQIQRLQLDNNGEESRFDLVNDMMAGWQMKDEAALLEWMKIYGHLDEMVMREFTML